MEIMGLREKLLSFTKEKRIKPKKMVKVVKGHLFFLGIDCVAYPTQEFGNGMRKLIEIYGPGILSGFKLASKKAGVEFGKTLRGKEEVKALFS